MTREENFYSFLPKDLADYDIPEPMPPIEKYFLVSTDDCDPWIMSSNNKDELIKQAEGVMEWFDNTIYDGDTMEVVFQRKKTV